MKHALFGGAVAAFILISALAAGAAKADAPARLLIGDAQVGGGRVVVVNASTQRVQFRLQVQDRAGGDAARWLIVSPRSVVLAPGEAKSVRLIARVPPGLQGERRADLTIARSRVGTAAAGAPAAPAIPVVLRAGSFDEPAVTASTSGRVGPDGLIDVFVGLRARQGTVSSHGDVVLCDARGEVGRLGATTVWPEVPVRGYRLLPYRVPVGMVSTRWVPRRNGMSEPACPTAVAPRGR